jgi:hypothetical protein
MIPTWITVTSHLGCSGSAARTRSRRGLWSFFAGLAVAVRKSYFTALPGYS